MGKLGCALVAVVLAAGTAACENADGETADPSATSTTASATPSPTPTGPTVPPLPDNAKGDTPEAAAHFVEHYIELMNYSASTGDTKAMRAASKDCHGCDVYMELYEKTYDRGGYFEDPDWKPVGPVAYKQNKRVTVLLDIKAPDRKFVRKAGGERKIGKGGTYKLRFVTRRLDGDEWMVTSLTQQDKTVTGGA